jgi:hypothetical protein
MIRYCYIVGEGPQDIEFLICFLKYYGLKRVTLLSKLDSFWEPLVPKTFPINDDLRSVCLFQYFYKMLSYQLLYIVLLESHAYQILSRKALL